MATAFKYYRMAITANNGDNAYQFSELRFYDTGGNYLTAASVTSTNNNTYSGSEGVDKLIDNDLNTKYCVDTNGGGPSIVVTFSSAVTALTYAWGTGNDSPGRDPNSWTIAGSNDQSTWTTLDTVSGSPQQPNRSTLVAQRTIQTVTTDPNVPVVVQSASDSSSSSRASSTVTLSSAPTAGNLLFAFLAWRPDQGQRYTSAPTGWTEVDNKSTQAASGLAVFQRTVATGDPSAYTFTLNTGTDRFAAVLVEVRGASSTLDGHGFQNTDANIGTPASFSVTPTTNGGLVLFAAASDGNYITSVSGGSLIATSTNDYHNVGVFRPAGSGTSGSASTATATWTGNPNPVTSGYLSIAKAIQSVATLTDTFDTQDTSKWTFGAAASVSGGTLNLTPNTSYTGSATSVKSYDLTGSSARVQVLQAPIGGNNTQESYLLLQAPGDNYIAVMTSGPNLVLRERASGSSSDVSLAYSATDHKWFRIREASGTVYWETSPDGTSWTVQRSKSTAVPLTSLQAVLLASCYGSEPSPTTVRMDNFNATPIAPSATGSATLAGSGTLSNSSTPSTAATQALSGTGTLSTSSIPKIAGSQALSGSGTLGMAAAPKTTGSTAAAGSGSLSATSGTAGSSSISLSGTGTLAASGVSATSDSAPLQGTGTLSASAVVKCVGSFITTGSGTLTSTVASTNSATIALSASGTLSATGATKRRLRIGGLTVKAAYYNGVPIRAIGYNGKFTI